MKKMVAWLRHTVPGTIRSSTRELARGMSEEKKWRSRYTALQGLASASYLRRLEEVKAFGV